MGFHEIYSYTITVILALSFVKVNTQVALSVATSEPYKCDKTLRLRCAGTAGGSCCGGSILWRADGSAMTVSTSDDSKYNEEVSSSYVDLVINQLEPSDFDKSYTCEHGFDTSSPFKPTGKFFCDQCGGYGYLFGFAGVEVALFFCIIVAVCCKKFHWNCIDIILISIVSNIASLVILILVPVPVCIVHYMCLKIPRLDPLFALLGFVLQVVFFALSPKILDIISVCLSKLFKKVVGSKIEFDHPCGDTDEKCSMVWQYKSSKCDVWTEFKTDSPRITITSNRLVIAELQESDSGYYRYVREHNQRIGCNIKHLIVTSSGAADRSSSRPPQGARRPEIRESAQAGAHKRTENSSPKKNEYASKLDSVPKGRLLPQIGENSPRELPQLDQGKSNITRLDPLGVTVDSGEKKKKKKKRKKQQENDEVET